MRIIVIFGASGHAKVVADIIEQNGHEVAGFITPDLESGSAFFGRPVLGRDEDLRHLVNKLQLDTAIIAVGDNQVRRRVARCVAKTVPALRFAAAVHPAAWVGRGATIGAGSVVMAGAIINSDARIGNHCIVNSGAIVDHDSVLEDFASIAPQAALAGNVTLGEATSVCMGALVAPGVRVGPSAIIGAGAVVLRDVPGFVLACGVPAHAVRQV